MEQIEIRKYPFNHVRILMESFDKDFLIKLSPDQLIKLQEFERKISENFYNYKFLNLIGSNNGEGKIVSLNKFSFIPDKWMRLTEKYLIWEKRKELNDNKTIWIYEFKRKYRK